MIYFFTGKPGNGKSLHMAQIIDHALRHGQNVIANFDIDDRFLWTDKNCKKFGWFIYEPNKYWLNNCYRNKSDSFTYLDGLYNFARYCHKKNKRRQILEHQTLLVFDECQELFNTRTWNRKDRLEWCTFFRQHRKFGYDIYLISQDDKVIDKQIRNILEYEIEHRCVNNYKLFGQILGWICGGKLFVAIKRWYARHGHADSFISSQYFVGRQKYYDFYNSYKVF